MEYKSIPQYTIGIEGRCVAGIAAVFGNVDDGEDRLWPGAFTKTIAERGRSVKHLWNHGLDGYETFCTPPIAHVLDLREVSRAELPPVVLQKAPEAMGGLLVKREYLRTLRGEEVYLGLVAGVPLEMSFGYDAIKWDFETVNDGLPSELRVRNLREVRLWDTSDVNFGMNPATTAAGKSLDDGVKILVDRFEALTRELKKSSALPQAVINEFQRLKTLIDGLSIIPGEKPANSKQPPFAKSRADYDKSLTQAREALRELEAVV